MDPTQLMQAMAGLASTPTTAGGDQSQLGSQGISAGTGKGVMPGIAPDDQMQALGGLLQGLKGMDLGSVPTQNLFQMLGPLLLKTAPSKILSLEEKRRLLPGAKDPELNRMMLEMDSTTGKVTKIHDLPADTDSRILSPEETQKVGFPEGTVVEETLSGGKHKDYKVLEHKSQERGRLRLIDEFNDLGEKMVSKGLSPYQASRMNLLKGELERNQSFIDPITNQAGVEPGLDLTPNYREWQRRVEKGGTPLQGEVPGSFRDFMEGKTQKPLSEPKPGQSKAAPPMEAGPRATLSSGEAAYRNIDVFEKNIAEFGIVQGIWTKLKGNYWEDKQAAQIMANRQSVLNSLIRAEKGTQTEGDAQRLADELMNPQTTRERAKAAFDTFRQAKALTIVQEYESAVQAKHQVTPMMTQTYKRSQKYLDDMDKFGTTFKADQKMAGGKPILKAKTDLLDALGPKD